MGGNRDRETAALLLEAKKRPDVTVPAALDHDKENIEQQGEDNLVVGLGGPNSSCGRRTRDKDKTKTTAEMLMHQGAEISSHVKMFVDIMKQKEVKSISVKNSDKWCGIMLTLSHREQVIEECLSYIGDIGTSLADIKLILRQKPGELWPTIVTDVGQLGDIDGNYINTVKIHQEDGNKHLFFM